ncbi:MAG: agmatine deiminase family protein [Bacteroidales bacterium]|nr:agmatine deiminase family protein [Bacteroidales bacterium]
MIQDNQCNRVFFSALLRERCPIAFRGLTEVLDKYEIPWFLLEGTNDIWCRDYMPIQILPNQFVGYDYHPDYLLQTVKDRATITDGNEICKKLGYACSNMLGAVKIDGGNMVKAGGRAIMTSKIFEENPSDNLSWFIHYIESAFGARLVILPWDANEEFGHSDGICRYIGEDRVLLTNYADFDSRMAERFRNILKPFFKRVEELTFRTNRKPHKHSWAYINWLQTERVLILPKFGIEEDEQAFEQISRLMPEYAGRIEMVDASDLVIHGGCFNCCSWTIREESCYDSPSNGSAL